MMVKGGNLYQKKSGRPWCDFCKETGHTKETCWTIHGKPLDWKPKSVPYKANQVFATPREDTRATNTQELFELFQTFLTQKITSPTTIGAGSFTQKGEHTHALNVRTSKKGTWIIDSGASDHMSGDVDLFSYVKPYTDDIFVKITDGSITKVQGIGGIRLSDKLLLESMLFVPKLECNLLSVGKISRDMNSSVNFVNGYCNF